MRIVWKEVDIYKSTQFKGKTLPEYIIYVMVDDTIIEAYIEIGDENKLKRIETLKPLHGTTN